MSKPSVASSLAYKFIERIAVKLIGLVIQIILARLLAPEIFGQLAILMVFINLSQTFIQGGLNTALVQDKNVTEQDYSTVFYISVAVALICNVILFIAAPFIADFYDAQSLIAPLRVYALVLFFAAFNSVQTARMQREMRFKATLVCTLVATVVSGVVGVFSAYAGFGLWALVIYNGAHIVISSVMMAIVDKWYPRFTFSVLRAKVLFNFGWKMLVSAVLCSLYYDIRSLIIGKKFSTEDLAYYDRGQQFPVIMSNTLDNAIQSVMFPVLARSQDEPEKLRESLKRTIALGMLIVTPVMVGLAVIAEPLIVLLLTDKWITAVPYMQLLCVAEVVLPLSSSNLVTVKAMGKSGTYMKLEMIRRIVMIAILLTAVFAFDSVLAIAISAIVIAWTDAIIIMTPMKKIIGYGVFSQLKDVWKTLLSSAIMGAAAFLVGMIPMPTVLLLFTQVFVGVAVYVTATWLINRSMFNHVSTIARGFLKK